MRDVFKCGKIKDEWDKGLLRIRGQVEGCEGREEGCGLSEVMVSSSCLVDHNVMRKLGWEGHNKMNVLGDNIHLCDHHIQLQMVAMRTRCRSEH